MTTTFTRFSPGQIVATPAALDLLAEHGVSPQTILRRHLAGDWGTLCSDDATLNDAAFIASRRESSAEARPGRPDHFISSATCTIRSSVGMASK